MSSRAPVALTTELVQLSLTTELVQREDGIWWLVCAPSCDGMVVIGEGPADTPEAAGAAVRALMARFRADLDVIKEAIDDLGELRGDDPRVIERLHALKTIMPQLMSE